MKKSILPCGTVDPLTVQLTHGTGPMKPIKCTVTGIHSGARQLRQRLRFLDEAGEAVVEDRRFRRSRGKPPQPLADRHRPREAFLDGEGLIDAVARPVGDAEAAPAENPDDLIAVDL